MAFFHGKQSERLKLERLQERALRVIYNCRTDTYEDLLCCAKLPFNRRRQEIIILMYKVRNGLVPDYIGELFNHANRGYSLRNADFNIPNYSTVRYGISGPIPLVQTIFKCSTATFAGQF